MLAGWFLIEGFKTYFEYHAAFDQFWDQILSRIVHPTHAHMLPFGAQHVIVTKLAHPWCTVKQQRFPMVFQ